MAINKILYDTSGEEIVDQNGNVTVYGIDGTANRVNKVQYGQTVLLDVTDTTAEASDVAMGETFYTKDGVKRTGTKSDASSMNINPSTASVTDDVLTIIDGGSATTRYITLFDNEVEIISDNPNYIWINNQPEAISVGDRYRVTWNNVAYTVTAINDATIGDWYGNTFGNASILGGATDPSNAPFVAYKTRWSANEMQLSTNETGTIDLKIEKVVYGDNLNFQTKSVTPTTSSQSVSADSGYDALDAVTVSAIPSNYIVPSGSQTITSNNTYDVTSLAEVVVDVQGSSKNVQIANGVNRVNTTEYTAVSGQTLTVAETGTYDVYWSGYRSSTSGTSGSQLYIDNTAYGSANTTFSNNGQSVHLSNVSLTKNQVIAVKARARNTSSYMYVSNLTIIQS